MRLFEEREFDAVTVETITEAADVGKGTFFNYFANKEAVVAYYFEKNVAFFAEMLHAPADHPVIREAERLRPPRPDLAGYPVWLRMGTIMHLAAERDGKSKRLVRTLLALELTNPLVWQASMEVHGRVTGSILELLRAGQASGEFRADIPPEQLALHLKHAHMQTLFSWAMSEDETDLHTAFDRTYQLIFEGIHNRRKPLPG